MIVQSDAHWMPQDPITEKQLITILSQMVRDILSENQNQEQDHSHTQNPVQIEKPIWPEQLGFELIVKEVPVRRLSTVSSETNKEEKNYEKDRKAEFQSEDLMKTGNQLGLF